MMSSDQKEEAREPRNSRVRRRTGVQYLDRANSYAAVKILSRDLLVPEAQTYVLNPHTTITTLITMVLNNLNVVTCNDVSMTSLLRLRKGDGSIMSCSDLPLSMRADERLRIELINDSICVNVWVPANKSRLPSPLRVLVPCAMSVAAMRRMVLNAVQLDDEEDTESSYSVYLSYTSVYDYHKLNPSDHVTKVTSSCADTSSCFFEIKQISKLSQSASLSNLLNDANSDKKRQRHTASLINILNTDDDSEKKRQRHTASRINLVNADDDSENKKRQRHTASLINILNTDDDSDNKKRHSVENSSLSGDASDSFTPGAALCCVRMHEASSSGSQQTTITQSVCRLEAHVSNMQRRRQRVSAREDGARRAATAHARLHQQGGNATESRIPVPTSLSSMSQVDDVSDPVRVRRSLSLGPSLCKGESDDDTESTYELRNHIRVNSQSNPPETHTRQDQTGLDAGSKTLEPLLLNAQSRRELARESRSRLKKFPPAVAADSLDNSGRNRRIWFKKQNVVQPPPPGRALSVDRHEISSIKAASLSVSGTGAHLTDYDVLRRHTDEDLPSALSSALLQEPRGATPPPPQSHAGRYTPRGGRRSLPLVPVSWDDVEDRRRRLSIQALQKVHHACTMDTQGTSSSDAYHRNDTYNPRHSKASEDSIPRYKPTNHSSHSSYLQQLNACRDSVLQGTKYINNNKDNRLNYSEDLCKYDANSYSDNINVWYALPNSPCTGINTAIQATTNGINTRTMRGQLFSVSDDILPPPFAGKSVPPQMLTVSPMLRRRRENIMQDSHLDLSQESEADIEWSAASIESVGHSEQHSDRHIDEHSDQHNDEHSDRHSDEHSDQHNDEHSAGHSAGHSAEHSDEYNAEMESIIPSRHQCGESSHDTGYASPGKDITNCSQQTHKQSNVERRNEERNMSQKTNNTKTNQHLQQQQQQEQQEQQQQQEQQHQHQQQQQEQQQHQHQQQRQQEVSKSSEALKRIISELRNGPGKSDNHQTSKVKEWRDKVCKEDNKNGNKHPSLHQLLQCCDLLPIKFCREDKTTPPLRLVDCDLTECAIVECRTPRGAKPLLSEGKGAFIPIAKATSSSFERVIAVKEAHGELKEGDCLIEVNRVSVRADDDDAESIMHELNARTTGWIQLVVARRRTHNMGNPYELSKEVEKLRVKYESLKEDAERKHDVIADLRLDLKDREDHLEVVQKNMHFSAARVVSANEQRTKQERLATHWRQQWQHKVVEIEEIKVQLQELKQQLAGRDRQKANNGLQDEENVMHTRKSDRSDEGGVIAKCPHSLDSDMDSKYSSKYERRHSDIRLSLDNLNDRPKSEHSGCLRQSSSRIERLQVVTYNDKAMLDKHRDCLKLRKRSNGRHDYIEDTIKQQHTKLTNIPVINMSAL